MFQEAETYIKKYLEDGRIEIEEIEVDIKLFMDYLSKKSVSPNDTYLELSISEYQKRVEDYLGDVRGKFFEYLVYNWVIETYTGEYNKTKCDVTKNGEQIDVLTETKNEIHIFECKVNLHKDEIQRIKKQLKKKKKAVKEKGKKVIPHLVIYFPIRFPSFSKIKSEFENEGISIDLSPFENIVDEYWKGKSKKEISRILEDQITSFFKRRILGIEKKDKVKVL